MHAKPVRVLHLTDTLEAGGAERVAVNLANLMPRDRYRTYLCSTRRDGPLAELVGRDVGRLRLQRKRRWDGRALWRLVRFVRDQQIQILHAHGTALLLANLASRFAPFPAVVWHDHFGRYAVEERSTWLYGWLTKRVGGVVAVNQPLAEWSRTRLGVPPGRVWFLPNFICDGQAGRTPPDLPGKPGARIACVANLRPEKDHATLLRAMARVIREVPAAHLLLVGASRNPAHQGVIRQEVLRQALQGHVSLLGHRQDVAAILRACDVGVLSSRSEGLPLSLLEYGMAGLPVVATQVGQCAEVLDHGQAGMLAPPATPLELAEALLVFLRSPERRRQFGERLHRRVHELYSPGPVIRQLERIYNTVLNRTPSEGEVKLA